jgi:hypothetical protein
MQCELDFVSIVGRSGSQTHIFILDRDPASRDAFLRLTLNADANELGVSQNSLKCLLGFHKGLLFEDALRAAQDLC